MSMQQIVNNSDSGLPSSSGGWAQSNSVTDCCRSPNPLSISPCQPTSPAINPAKSDRKCSVEGCNKIHLAKGYCCMHYARVVKHGTPGNAASIHVGRKRINTNAKCSVEGCQRPYRTAGYCKLHYSRKQRSGNVGPRESMKLCNYERAELRAIGKKRCPRCKTIKSLQDFYLDKGRKSGLTSRCKDCEGFSALKTRFGITQEEYESLFALQDGKCAICQQPDNGRKLAVDHNHNFNGNGKQIRGLCCMKCNQGLGLYRDNPALLRAAANYLESHAKQDFTNN